MGGRGRRGRQAGSARRLAQHAVQIVGTQAPGGVDALAAAQRRQRSTRQPRPHAMQRLRHAAPATPASKAAPTAAAGRAHQRQPSRSSLGEAREVSRPAAEHATPKKTPKSTRKSTTRIVRPARSLGEAHEVKRPAGIAVVGALERALKAQEAADLGLAAWLAEVLPALDLDKAAQEQLHSQQRGCAAQAGGGGGDKGQREGRGEG